MPSEHVRPDALYPECPECAARDGIHRAIVGPATGGIHDVEQYELHCGHTMAPDAKIEEGVVALLKLTDPDTVEVRE